MDEPYVPLVVPPDPARDARVAARRAADARRAGAALDRLMDSWALRGSSTLRAGYADDLIGVLADAVASRISDPKSNAYHNGHYGVPGSIGDPRMHVRGCLGAFGQPCIAECGPNDHYGVPPGCGRSVDECRVCEGQDCAPLQETYPGSGVLE